MANGNVTMKIGFEIEPIVKVDCTDEACRFNMEKVGLYCCNLKHISIGAGGKCESREAKDAAE